MTEIRTARPADLEILASWDRHLTREDLKKAISDGRVLMAEVAGVFAGWLRWNLFWDNTPFVNLLFVLEPHRGRGIGKALMADWERKMANYPALMTSTAANETAQRFYEKLGYYAVGGFFPAGESYELILAKETPK